MNSCYGESMKKKKERRRKEKKRKEEGNMHLKRKCRIRNKKCKDIQENTDKMPHHKK